MIAFFANIFGYLLNFFYSLIGNYGLAIILFSIVIKLLMLPLSIKQQKTAIKSAEMQNEMKQIQFKYKNDPEKMNQATIELYKREKMSPFSGCLSAIIQLVLLFSVFYMVKEPLTYMEKIEPTTIDYCVSILKEKGLIQNENDAYAEIALIREANTIKETNETAEEDKKIDQSEIDKLYMDMGFLGIDLSKVPTQSLNDWKVYIIPVLYVISSFISMRLAATMQTKANSGKDAVIEVEGDKGKDKEKGKEEQEIDPMAQANKSMSLIMPIMSISISLIAPLGLALYWLMNNILMIIEKLVLNKVLKGKEE